MSGKLPMYQGRPFFTNVIQLNLQDSSLSYYSHFTDEQTDVWKKVMESAWGCQATVAVNGRSEIGTQFNLKHSTITLYYSPHNVSQCFWLFQLLCTDTVPLIFLHPGSTSLTSVCLVFNNLLLSRCFWKFLWGGDFLSSSIPNVAILLS